MSNRTESDPADDSHPLDLSQSQTDGPMAIHSVDSRVLGSVFSLDSRYRVLDAVGSGAYGVVAAVTDTVTGKLVAVKKIEKWTEHPIVAKRTLREMKILRLVKHENIIPILQVQLPASLSSFTEIYLIMELMESDLTSVIKSNQPLSDEHCQFFLYQLLRGLKYLHSAGVLHRDLKPRNLLVNSNCDLKICDFGLARPQLSSPGLGVMTDYVATRWYRPPEVLLLYKKYTTAMDVWSVGCIFGELLLRKPLLPGKDVETQLDMIIKLIGTPSAEDIRAIPNNRSRTMIEQMPKQAPKDLKKVLRGVNPLAIDLLKRFLAFNPKKRITVSEALEHPYLARLHLPRDEPTAGKLSLFDFRFESEEMTVEEIKGRIYEEILMYHFPDRMREYERRKDEYVVKETLESNCRESGEDIVISG